MSGKQESQRGPGGKALRKTRGVEGRGRGMGAAFAPPAKMPTLAPPSTAPTSGRSTARKSTRKSLRIEAAAMAPPSEGQAGAGSGTAAGGSADQTAPPGAKEEWCSQEELDLSLGGVSGQSPILRPGMEEYGDKLAHPSTPPSPSGSSGPESEGELEQRRQVKQEGKIEVQLPESPPEPLAPRLAPPAPNAGHGGSAQSSSQEAAQGIPEAASQPGGSRISQVWKHFRVVEDIHLAECQICRQRVSRGRQPRHFSTTALMNHLKRHHQAQLLQEERQAATGAPARAPPARSRRESPPVTSTARALPESSQWVVQGGQVTPMEVVVGAGASVPTQGSAAEFRAVNRDLAAMMAVGGYPFSLADEEMFHRFCLRISPWYTPPSSTTILSSVLPSLYRAARSHVEAEVSRVSGTLHFTSDVWTACHVQDAYISLTAHWWDVQEVLDGMAVVRQGCRAGYRHALLHVEPFDVRHTTANIRRTILRLLEGWVGSGSGATKGFVVTDGALGMKTVVKDLGLRHISCAAHLLHLVVKDALGIGPVRESTSCSETYEYRLLTTKCRNIVSHFNRCSMDSFRLREKQLLMGVPDHSLLGDVGTRWNSTRAMFERLVEQRRALDALVQETGIFEHGSWLSDREWEVLAQTVEVLEPFKIFTEMLSSNVASLGLVCPMLHKAREVMAPFVDPGQGRPDLIPAVSALAQRLQRGVEERFGPLCKSGTYMVAAMCDPRVKGSIAEREQSFSEWRALLVQRLVCWMSQEEAGEAGGGASTSAAPTPAASPCPEDSPLRRPDMGFLLGFLQPPSSSPGRVRDTREESASMMVGAYLGEPQEPENTCPSNYWARQEAAWPALSRMARFYLSCPPTSVQSERAFSHASHIVCEHRSRLAPERVQELVYLKINLPAFGYPELAFEED